MAPLRSSSPRHRREIALSSDAGSGRRESALAAIEWPGSGPSFVTLHGLAGNALVWTGLAESLADRHVLAVDLPGHGESPPPDPSDAGGWAVETIGARVAGLVAPHCREGAVFIGHSWGGVVALAAAAAVSAAGTYPVRGLVLVDSVPARPIQLRRAGETADRLFAGEYGPWPDLATAIAAVRALPQYSPWSIRTEATFRRAVRIEVDGRVIAKLTRQKAIDIIEPAFAEDLTQLAPNVHAPVLILQAGESSERPDTNVSLWPDASMVVLPGNHWLQLDNLDGVAAALADWMRVKRI
jgi:pimeloyl-ACP methyl ester carboxylesterase